MWEVYSVKIEYKIMGRFKNGCDELLESLIGLTKEEGTEMGLKNNYKVRITREDSTIYVVTMDLRFDRINLEIDNGVITKCGVG